MSARRYRRGNAVLEFALTFGLLWAILGGCFKIAYSIYLYQGLINALGGAARYASRVDFDEPNHTFVTSVRNMAAYGDPAGTSPALVPGLSAGNISVTWAYDSKGVPMTITIAVTGYSVNAVFQSFTWNGKPAITVRYAGSFKS